jgi:methylenetetrahydrofolate reductase (NADPH)
VYDLSVMELIGLAHGLRRDGVLLSGARIDEPPRFFIGVADVPLTPGYTFDRLEEKADAGADFVQTQIVFDVGAFEAWAEKARARGIFERLFVLVGVAVARGARSARYIRDHLPGVMVPDRVIELLEEAGPDAEAEGVRLTVEVVAKLKAMPGIAGIHVMGLGHMDPVRHVVESAGLRPRPAMA